MNDEVQSEQHSILKSVVLSLAPGLLVLLFFVIFAPHGSRLGLPPILVIFTAIPLVLVPFELGYLLRQGKKLNGRITLERVVLFRDKLSIWQFLWLVPILLFWAAFCFGVLAPKIDPVITSRFFSWLPGFFSLEMTAKGMAQFSKTVLWITLALGLVFNGLIGPVVEELYFRGYLLPRLSKIGGWAPALNVLLFSLYHFFSPWQNITRILALLPYVYVVWWKRNIYIGVITHCALNTIGMILTAYMIFGK